VHCTFSTLTHFPRTFSTMTIESFHDDVRHLQPYMLILFHAYTRPHIEKLDAILVVRSRRATRLSSAIAVPIPSTIAVTIAIPMFI
jgi:hypothetical protein